MCVLMQWFCQHDPASGEPREEPYNIDFTRPGGVDLAARVLQWLADGMPGLDYKRKAPRLVCRSQAFHLHVYHSSIGQGSMEHLAEHASDKNVWLPSHITDAENAGGRAQRNAAGVLGAAAASECS